MGIISAHLVSAKQRIDVGKGIIRTQVADRVLALGRDGAIQQRSWEAGKTYDRENGNWEQTGVSWEEKKWGDTTYDVTVDNTVQGDKNWLQENSYIDANVSLYETEFESLQHEGSVYSDQWGSENNRLTVDALGYETGGEASLSYGADGFTGTVSANAEAYLVRAEYTATYGPAYLGVEGSIGAEASASGEIQFNPLDGDVSASVGGEAFAGGKLEGEMGVDGQYGTVGGNAGVTYGIGVEANADVGLEDWTVKAEFDLGATLGVGIDLGFDVEIDAKETVSDLAGGAKDLAGDGLDAGKKVTGWIPFTPWD